MSVVVGAAPFSAESSPAAPVEGEGWRGASALGGVSQRLDDGAR